MPAQGIRDRRRRRGIAGAMMTLAVAWPLSRAHAQRPVLAGRVAPTAVGPAVRPPAPIGGLRTTPLSRGAPADLLVRRQGWPLGWTNVADARALPYGVTVTAPASPPAVSAPAWIPSYAPPRWVADSSAPASPLWRDLIVTEVWCTMAGACVERPQRVRARWVARCDCYAFGDAWNRIWQVGTRGRGER
jgi:hypothetical protein